MLTAPMTPMLLRMTGPMILGIIAILAFNLVDTFFIGMLGTQALAAISFTFPVTFVVTSLTMGLGRACAPCSVMPWGRVAMTRLPASPQTACSSPSSW